MNKTYVYESIERRIEAEPSVMVWEYIDHDDGMTEIKIQFQDEETCLGLTVDTNNLGDLQDALELIDNYFVTKRLRS